MRLATRSAKPAVPRSSVARRSPAACWCPLCSIPTFSQRRSPGDSTGPRWGLGLGTALLNILGSINFNPEAGLAATFLGSFALSVMSLALVGVMGAEFGVDPPPDLISKAVLGIDMAALLPGLINTWKLTGVILAAVVAVADVVMGFAGRSGDPPQRAGLEVRPTSPVSAQVAVCRTSAHSLRQGRGRRFRGPSQAFRARQARSSSTRPAAGGAPRSTVVSSISTAPPGRCSPAIPSRSLPVTTAPCSRLAGAISNSCRSGMAPPSLRSLSTRQTSARSRSAGQNQVWTRDSNNSVNQLSQPQPLSQGQLQPVALAGPAAHIAADYDGTLWSCTGNEAQALRVAGFLSTFNPAST